MDTISPTACARCGGTLRSSFVGRICPRCLLTSVASAFPEEPAEETPGHAPAAAELCVGARVGDYELVDVLGRGGMAVVYLARQISLDRLVALKTIAGSLATDTLTQERFRREARSVARLDHPGIVAVHDAGVLAGVLFYTMDYVAGPNLGQVLRERPLALRETAERMRQVAAAVGYAHAHGIVHRDLKPANVLLDNAGDPHVADFGLAFEFEGAGNGLTVTGDVLGTPPYMAPEVLAGGAGRATPAADVYSLGAMLFQMLTGRTPFIGDTLSEILNLVLREPPPALRLFNPAVPRELEIICLKCLEKHPSGRFPDAGALAEELSRHLRGEPILSRPVSVPVRLLRWSRRRPALTTLIVALALGTIGASWAALAIDASRQRAVRAEANAQEDLWRANLAHAQAARRTTQAGARHEALAAVADAAKFRPSLTLRNEAIATLCLQDAEVRRSWPLNVKWSAAVAFDPLLETYLAETQPGRLVRRSCANDRELGRLDVPDISVVGTPVFSPGGRYLAARYADDTVRVWEVGIARMLFALPGRPSPLRGGAANSNFDLDFSPDAGRLAVGDGRCGFKVYAVPGGAELGAWMPEAPDFRPIIIRLSPNGRQIAVVGQDRSEVQLLDAATLVTQRIVPLPGVPTCLAWNPAGEQLAVGTRNARVHLVAAATGQVVETFSAYESGGVADLVFHPKWPILAGSGSEAVRFWDAANGRLLTELEGVNTRPVLAFDPAGTRLCAYNEYNDRAALAEIQPSPIYASDAPAEATRSAIATGAFDISPDGRWLVCASFGEVQLRDALTGRPVQTLTSQDPNEMMTAQFTPDGRALFVGSLRTGLRRVEIVISPAGLPSFGPERPLDAEPDFSIEGVAADGRVLLISEKNEAAKIVHSGDPAAAATRWPVAKITSAAFSADGCQVLTEAGESVPGEAAVKVWDLAPAGPRLAASFGDDTGGRVQCARAGGWVLVTGDNKSELWQTGSWRRGPALPAELQGETHHARLSPDGRTIAIEKNGRLHLVATSTGEVLAVCETPTNPAGICVNEIFSADGQHHSLFWQYGSVHLWDLTAMHRELAALGLDWKTPP